MQLRFPYEARPTLHYGNIPTIKFSLPVESKVVGFVKLTFLFDTGADVTSLPASLAEHLGINLKNCPIEKMTGYEGYGVTVYRSQIRIKFNKKVLVIPCVFHPNENVPIILGRAGILSRFNIHLNGKKKEIDFEEV